MEQNALVRTLVAERVKVLGYIQFSYAAKTSQKTSSRKSARWRSRSTLSSRMRGIC